MRPVTAEAATVSVSQVVAGLGMSVAAGEIAGLSREHHFLFGHRAHVEGLVRSRAGRENVGSGIVQHLE